MKILLVTDAWEPQVNGVVRTYQNIIKILKTRDVDIQVVHPHYKNFKTIPLPGYPEIEIVTNPKLLIVELEQALSSNRHIHIATEGPLGLTARIYLAKRGYPFTTGFHTLFPEFIQKRFYIPAKILYPFFRWFHNGAVATLVPTTKIRDQLIDKGFSKPSVWTRGVDLSLFNPSKRTNPSRYIVYVARASKEKNIDEFCNLNYDRKIFVGDGPYLPELKQRYPEVVFVGKKHLQGFAKMVDILKVTTKVFR
jgi:glycosyltransferase involved in cell wall biosynthesis